MLRDTGSQISLDRTELEKPEYAIEGEFVITQCVYRDLKEARVAVIRLKSTMITGSLKVTLLDKLPVYVVVGDEWAKDVKPFVKQVTESLVVTSSKGKSDNERERRDRE